MKKTLASLLCLAAFLGSALPAFARYEIFLSTSPNNKYRVAITQEVLRRVGDQVFFEYPIYLTDKAGRKLFLMEKGSVPFVAETPRGTFTIDREFVKFDWAADSKKVFFHLKATEKEWRVYLVDIGAKKTQEITPELKPKMIQKAARKGWECERPVVELVQWLKPDQPIFRLFTVCVIPGDEKQKQWGYENWVLYDTAKKKVVKECTGCEKEKAMKVLSKEPKKKKPKPTPIPEETPVSN